MKKKVVKSITIDPLIEGKIKILGDYEGRNFSSMVNYILGKYLGNNQFESNDSKKLVN
jgi:hypothetical protein